MDNNYQNNSGGKSFGSGNNQIFISATDMELVYKMRRLPVHLRLAILGLHRHEIEQYLSAHRSDYIKTLYDFAKLKNWKWRDTGEKVQWEDVELPGRIKSRKQLLNELKSDTCRLTMSEMDDYIEWFAGDRAKVYQG